MEDLPWATELGAKVKTETVAGWMPNWNHPTSRRKYLQSIQACLTAKSCVSWVET